MQNKPIVILHISDIHIDKEKEISDFHLRKIVDSVKVYEHIKFNNIIIVISGDITQSGKEYQYKNVRKIIGTLIRLLKEVFNCDCSVLIVPGNHDVDHAYKDLSVEIIKKKGYESLENDEINKLSHFYNIAKYNKCFLNNEIYCDSRTIDVGNVKIKINLINNAIFSFRGEYKGMLYLPDKEFIKIEQDKESDYVLTVMHHAPDFYKDDIKNRFEAEIVSKTNILFHGHEHYISNKKVSYNSNNQTVIQSCGCLCEKGEWDNGSYFLGVLYPDELKYEYKKYKWNRESKQYEYLQSKEHFLERKSYLLKVSEEFEDFLAEDTYKNYYSFPTIVQYNKDGFSK